MVLNLVKDLPVRREILQPKDAEENAQRPTLNIQHSIHKEVYGKAEAAFSPERFSGLVSRVYLIESIESVDPPRVSPHSAALHGH
jgi:hypothetical protein